MAELAVTVAGVALIAALPRFFFKPGQATQARVEGDVQTVDIRVKGGCSPSFGAERVVLNYDPGLVDRDRLAKAVHDLTRGLAAPESGQTGSPWPGPREGVPVTPPGAVLS